MGFSDPPDSDPNGETVLRFVFDNKYSPPGNSSNGINPNNVLYYASVLSHPSWNDLAGLATESFQGFQAMQGDPPCGDVTPYIFMRDDEGNLHYNDFAKFINRVRDYFNPGDNI